MIARGVALTLGTGLVASASAAVVLNPGAIGQMMVDTLPAGPGAALAVTWASQQDDKGRFTAEVDSVVTLGNSYGGNALTFWYRLTNADQTPDGSPLTGLSVPLQIPAQVKVDQTVALAEKAQVAVNTSGAITFSWIFSPIPETAVTSWLSIETPFLNFAFGHVGVLDGAGEDVFALVPGDILIPEPGTYAGLFALGLAGFAAYRRFRA